MYAVLATVMVATLKCTVGHRKDTETLKYGTLEHVNDCIVLMYSLKKDVTKTMSGKD